MIDQFLALWEIPNARKGEELMNLAQVGFTRRRSRTKLSLFVLLIVTFFCSLPAIGAPVMFEFDAAIGTVPTGVPFDPGFQFCVGDNVTGSFTFDPVEVTGDMFLHAVQPYDFSLAINGVSLVAPSFEIESINNVFIISDFPPSGLTDQLRVGGAGLMWPENTPPLNFDPSQTSFSMSLFGAATILNQASFPPEVHTWNNFNLWRQLNVTFRNNMGGVIGFQATVGGFVSIPEPSPFWISSVVFSLILLRYRLAHRVSSCTR